MNSHKWVFNRIFNGVFFSKILVECRNNLEGNTIELSMGMSHDFEKAVRFLIL